MMLQKPDAAGVCAGGTELPGHRCSDTLSEATNTPLSAALDPKLVADEAKAPDRLDDSLEEADPPELDGGAEASDAASPGSATGLKRRLESVGLLTESHEYKLA